MSKDQIKKVKPYPFAGELKDSGAARACQIVLLTRTGLLLDVFGGNAQPGDKVDVSFRTPVLGQSVQFQGLVVKVYNQLTSESPLKPVGPATDSVKTGTVHRLEIHIRSIDPLHINHIAKFLDQIGQKR